MHWKLVVKDKSKQPANGTYANWKQQIAEECFFQCVYCAIHESQFGGTLNYHIDHFRPLSKFAALVNDICNLFYACPICNKFKSNDWPAEPDLRTASYPDPCKVDYNDLFRIRNDFNLVGLYVSSNYLIERLFLNRAQLVFERRESFLRSKTSSLITEVKSLIDLLAAEDLKEAYKYIDEIDSIKNNLLGLEDYRKKLRPYEQKDVKKK